ncbi:glycosyltransferase family 9 protein [Noviherbaspirillum aridicola]|uniref:ADP-heptose--LPS heptosyltransferase n=1 Tax=Noviherbaspirillum aridicola TaxID=2849687 RepID=A0ABQ4Q262_9BURK|nr:glycosyltransferase family 9 protein [Noviherbaspirillum aridicola]GIZ51278.1 ADP-heptose--LPS heptosyltransferase [Noviherbaspirillum aridicola]
MKRILIIRTSAIGDVVFASPFAAALRRTYPEAHIAWLIEPGIDALIAHDPAVDERILWPKSEWQTLWREGRRLEVFRRVLALRRRLHEGRFDVAIDLQGLMKSGFLTWLSGAKRRIGLGSREGSQHLMTEVVPRGGDPARISSEYLHLARQLGLDAGDFMARLHPGKEAGDKALARLSALGLAPGRYAVFAAFTTRPQKHWTVAGWQQLAPLVQERTGLTPVLLGGPADKAAAEEIAAGVPGLINLVGQTGLSEAAALVAHAGALVGVDTGLTHMGIAFSVPTVALFGSTCPYTVTGRANARVVWLGLPCSPCKRRPTCGGSFHCMGDISALRAVSELSQAMEKKP